MQKYENNNLIENFIILFFIPITFCTIVNYYYVKIFNGYILMLYMLITLFLTLIKKKNPLYNSSINLTALYSLFLILYFIIFTICGLITSPEMYGLAFASVIIIISIQIVNFDDYDLLKKIYTISMISYFISGILTYRGLLIFPGASRVLASPDMGKYGFDQYIKMGIGGFQYIYSIVVMLPFIFYLIKKNNNIKKFFYIFTLVLFISIILKAGYTLAIFLMAILMIFYFVLGKIKRRTYKIILLLAMIVLFFISREMLQSFILSLTDWFDSPAVRQHLLETVDILEGKGDDVVRIELYQSSLDSFLNSPIMGRLFNYDFSKSKHSTLLDILADGGLLCFIPYFLFWVQWHIFTKNACKSPESKNLLDISFWGFMLIQTINPIFTNYQIIYTYMVLIPVGIRMIEHKKHEQGEKDEYIN